MIMIMIDTKEQTNFCLEKKNLTQNS